MLATGCENSAHKPVQVRPADIAAPSTEVALTELPVVPRSDVRALTAPATPDGIEHLLEQSRAAFQAGRLDYRQGHLRKAREEFDRSLDDLLFSGFDIEGDARLSVLYHEIVDSVHNSELASFREGDGFSEQGATPAPIDEIPEIPEPEPGQFAASLRDQAEGEVGAVAHDLPLTVNDYVLTYLNYFQTPRGSAIVQTGLRRAGRYRAMVERVLREEGVPQDLIYLAQAESAFQPRAVSRAGARGMWQFMSYSGRQYGLEKTWWVDDRQDPEQATHAAARLLRDLYGQFGDWYLAMAAYNSGASRVRRAVERTGYADFWELYRRNVLPRETRNYVPIILALTLISKDPARYGIEIQPEPALRADTVKPGKPIDLRLVAETIDTDVETLRALNPRLLRLVTPTDAEFSLQLPEGTAEQFFAGIAAIPAEKWVSWRWHRVAQGETLSTIAKNYHVAPTAIAEANELVETAHLEEGQKLIIPAASRPKSALGKLLRYRVRRGDTLTSIASEFSVTTAELRKWNRLKSDRIRRGARLRVYPGGRGQPKPSTSRESLSAARANTASPLAAAVSASSVVHQVKAGETLWSIARAYRTSVEAIRGGNRYLFTRPLQVGDTLTILAARY